MYKQKHLLNAIYNRAQARGYSSRILMACAYLGRLGATRCLERPARVGVKLVATQVERPVSTLFWVFSVHTICQIIWSAFATAGCRAFSETSKEASFVRRAS